MARQYANRPLNTMIPRAKSAVIRTARRQERPDLDDGLFVDAVTWGSLWVLVVLVVGRRVDSK